MDEERVVTIARFSLAFQAELARVALEHEGIPCAVVDSAQAGMTLGVIIPVRLQVFEDDVKAAKEILVRDGLYSFEDDA